MISKKWWMLVRFLRRLWVRATLYCVFAIVVALAAIWADPYMPSELPRQVGSKAVDSILTIIASSMLAVTTFSLTTLVSATSAAASNATPRATSLLLEDTTSQRALSTFLGSFLFSLVGLIALNTELYGEGGRFILFIATLCVVALIVVTLLQWIDHLAGLGRVAETIARVERAATSAYRDHRRLPYLGGQPYRDVPEGAIEIHHKRLGYLQHLDVQVLSGIAEEAGADIYVQRRPGSHCDPSAPIASVVLRDSGDTYKPELSDRIRAAFTLGDRRSFDQDPRFGLIALSEIGSRALSPGINDPGTAIDVLATLVRVMAPIAREETPDDREEIKFEHVFVPPLREADLIDAAFMPMSRDGAGQIEVAIRLQKALMVVSATANPDLRDAARRFADTARERALAGLNFEPDRERLLEETVTG
ncbi:MAG: DUF2254 domain-containing protein [Pseudorhizobium sp.]